MDTALILDALGARVAHRTTSTLTYNNAPTLAPIQSSFSTPTTIITTKYVRLRTFACIQRRGAHAGQRARVIVGASLDSRASQFNTITFPAEAISKFNQNLVHNNGWVRLPVGACTYVQACANT